MALERPRRRTRGKCLAILALLSGGTACRAHRGSSSSDAVARGRVAIAALGCGSCHRIDGVMGANGDVGPSLTGVGRQAIIAGRLPNTPDNMLRWIANPQATEPGVAMPPFADVSDSVLHDVVAYLRTLR